MKGTVQYYVEALQTNVMNRLVTNEIKSLHATYEQLLEEINEVDEEVRTIYKANLLEAFSIVRNAMAFAENDGAMI